MFTESVKRASRRMKMGSIKLKNEGFSSEINELVSPIIISLSVAGFLSKKVPLF